jgi:CheY-like chemotaxis protein
MNAAGASQVLEGASTVLVVEDEAETRNRFGQWLEDAGYTVSSCPGPALSGHSCLGVRDLPCPLEHAADIVLLDSRRLAGVGQKEKPGWRLIRYYLKAGKPVVVIADRYRPDRKFRPEQVTVLSSDPGPESLLLAVRRMLNESRRW